MLDYFDPLAGTPPFALFGPAHLGLLLLIGAAGTVWLVAGRRAGPERQETLRRAFGLLLLLNESSTHVYKLFWGTWTPVTDLPLQMCGAMAWITAIAFLLGIRKVYPMIYFFGVAGAVQGVITPDTALGFPHYLMIETVFAHSMLVLGGLWVVLVEGYRPKFKHVVILMVGLNIAAFVMFWVNTGLGSNYLFVNAKPPNASIVDLLPPWPWYILWLEVIATLLFSALWLPFAGRRGAQVETAATV